MQEILIFYGTLRSSAVYTMCRMYRSFLQMALTLLSSSPRVLSFPPRLLPFVPELTSVLSGDPERLQNCPWPSGCKISSSGSLLERCQCAGV